MLGLAPVVVGGIIGFAAGVGGNWFNQRWQAEADKKRRREDKFQELVTALYEHRHWLKALGNSRAFGSTEPSEVSPMARIRAIAAIYFPTYRQALTKLDAAADHYEMWTFLAGQERGSKGKLEQVTLEAGQKAYSPYAEAFREHIDRLEEFATREFRAEAE
jgi:uncharacterized protein YqcC (DUF446 family)